MEVSLKSSISYFLFSAAFVAARSFIWKVAVIRGVNGTLRILDRRLGLVWMSWILR